MAELYQQDKTSLFRNGQCESYRLSIPGHFNPIVGVRRIVLSHNIVIFYSKFCDGYDFTITPGDNFEMLYHEYGRRDDYSKGVPFYQFNNCQPIKEWIGRPMPLEASMGLITKFIECECEIVRANEPNSQIAYADFDLDGNQLSKWKSESTGTGRIPREVLPPPTVEGERRMTLFNGVVVAKLVSHLEWVQENGQVKNVFTDDYLPT